MLARSLESEAHDKVLDNNRRIGIWKCWFLRRGENRSTRRKTSRSKEENQQQTSTHIWRRVRESNPGHIGGRCALSPLSQPCSQSNIINWVLAVPVIRSLKLFPSTLYCHWLVLAKKSADLPQKPSTIFNYLRQSSENNRQHSCGLQKTLQDFGNLRKVVGNLGKMVKNVVISMFI